MKEVNFLQYISESKIKKKGGYITKNYILKKGVSSKSDPFFISLGPQKGNLYISVKLPDKKWGNNIGILANSIKIDKLQQYLNILNAPNSPKTYSDKKYIIPKILKKLQKKNLLIILPPQTQ